MEFKRCSRGDECVHPDGPLLPATYDFFWKRKSGLNSECKICARERSRSKYASNPNLQREYSKKWQRKNKLKVLHNVLKWQDGNRDKVKHYRKKWDNSHKKQRDERIKKWKRMNKLKLVAMKHNRNARKRNLPDTVTNNDIEQALAYFNGCCAACGRPLRDLFGDHTVAMDHWIPLSDPCPDNPGTVPTNMIPLCHGINGCNNKKGNADPVEWLEREFGKRKARIILARIEAFFEWVQAPDDSADSE